MQDHKDLLLCFLLSIIVWTLRFRSLICFNFCKYCDLWSNIFLLHVDTQLSQGLSGGSVVKNPPANAGDAIQSLGWEDNLEKEMATLSSIAWEIPWTEEPGGLQSMGPQKSQTWLSDWTTTTQLCSTIFGKNLFSPWIVLVPLLHWLVF